MLPELTSTVTLRPAAPPVSSPTSGISAAVSAAFAAATLRAPICPPAVVSIVPKSAAPPAMRAVSSPRAPIARISLTSIGTAVEAKRAGAYASESFAEMPLELRTLFEVVDARNRIFRKAVA